MAGHEAPDIIEQLEELATGAETAPGHQDALQFMGASALSDTQRREALGLLGIRDAAAFIATAESVRSLCRNAMSNGGDRALELLRARVSRATQSVAAQPVPGPRPSAAPRMPSAPPTQQPPRPSAAPAQPASQPAKPPAPATGRPLDSAPPSPSSSARGDKGAPAPAAAAAKPARTNGAGHRPEISRVIPATAAQVPAAVASAAAAQAAGRAAAQGPRAGATPKGQVHDTGRRSGESF